MTLGGVIFARNAIQYDYCLKESVDCLKELCDEVIVLDAGSDDGTDELIKSFQDRKTRVILLNPEDWEAQTGREKLAYFQNLALSFLDTDYYFLLQADEIIHEDSFPSIRCAVDSGKDAFLAKRINLWGSPDTYINVTEDRQPCSQYVVRLARTEYQSVGDGESIGCVATQDFINGITIFHYGFVRNKDVMKSKVINMQENVFRLGFHDPKLDNSDTFDSTLWFKGGDLSPLDRTHPKYITNWIQNRP